jgi:hypothetical protein
MSVCFYQKIFAEVISLLHISYHDEAQSSTKRLWGEACALEYSLYN